MLNLKQNKKGVSIIVGYVLLIVFAVIMGAIVFQWLKTYVPAESLNCPDGVSLFVKEAVFNESSSQLNLTLKNNGRFNVAGYFIHTSNDSAKEEASIDLSSYVNESLGGKKFGNSVLFLPRENSMSPGDTKTNIFEIPTEIGKIYSVRIIPTRFQEVSDRQRFVSCGDAKTSSLVGEPRVEIVCVPETCSDLGYTQCNPPGWSRSDGCGGSLDCGTCGTGFFCDAAGQCISTSCTPAPDPTLLGVCGTRVCGTATNGTCGQVSCGTCTGLTTCNLTTGQCVSTIGNGVCDAGEDCSEPACVGLQASCPSGQICVSGSCSTIGNGVCDAGETCAQEPVACEGQQAQCRVGETCVGGSCVFNAQGGFNSCADYCALFSGYTTGGCVQNPQQCSGLSPSGTYIGNVSGANATRGNNYCTTGNADTCCCQP